MKKKYYLKIGKKKVNITKLLNSVYPVYGLDDVTYEKMTVADIVSDLKLIVKGKDSFYCDVIFTGAVITPGGKYGGTFTLNSRLH